MRCVYIYIDTSHRGDTHVKASVKDINNLKCRHHFGESKIGGWIRLFKEDWCWIGNPSISFCPKTKVRREVGGVNQKTIFSCLKNSSLNKWKFEKGFVPNEPVSPYS